MSLAIQTDAELIKLTKTPLSGTLTRRVTLGATTSAGMPVAQASDAKYDPASAGSMTLALFDGIALKAGVDGSEIDIAYDGPVECLTGATPGALVYLGDTAGTLSHSAGTKSIIVGKAISETILMIFKQYVSLS